jgi:hypothetical protein
MRLVLAAVLLLAAAPAVAGAPLAVKNGSTVRVALGGKREPGVGLRPRAEGWRLELRAGQGVAEVIDVTQGVARTKWLVPIEDGALVLDATRFSPGHAYRVALGESSVLVYLYPPPGRKGPARLAFSDDEPADNGGIEIAPKGAL